MTTRLSYNNSNAQKNNASINPNKNNDHIDDNNFDSAAVLYTSTHPFHHNAQLDSRLCANRPGAASTMSGTATSSSAGAEEQRAALLTSHVGIPPEITDSVQSWIDVQESIDEAMRESPIPGGRLSVGSSSVGVGNRATAASFSGGTTPSSLARLTFLHPSSERLLQALDSPTPSSTLLLQSPVYIDSPGLMSVYSHSPPPEEEEEEKMDSVKGKKNSVANNSEILERICFDRVNAAAACLNSQVESGVIDSEKVVGITEAEERVGGGGGEPGEAGRGGRGEPARVGGDWVWDWSSRPEATPPKEAQYSHVSAKHKRTRQHRKTNQTTSFYDALVVRLEVFSAENFPVLFVSHACSVLLGAALMLFYFKRR